MTTKPYRTDLLTTEQLYNLDVACRPIRRAFDGPMTGCYLVGSAGFANVANDGRPARDVDVRLMLDDDQFAEVCPTRERWELLCLAITAYLRDRSGLANVDFQIQQTSLANARFGDKPRNPLGMGRTFAGGGDGTPGWEGSSAGPA